MAGASIMESLFQKTLDDLIKGFRSQLIGETRFIGKALEEIRREIKSTDLDTKSIALQKLCYLHSIYGVDMSWASFHIVELVGSVRFADKKIAYLAISLTFHEGTDVILLVTNQFRKDLNSSNEYEVCLVLECLSVMASTDLSRDLTPEIFTLLASNKILIKKKAIAVLLRVFNMYPDAVRVCFKRLVENLDSSNAQVLSAVTGVFCELTAREPLLYLPLAPEFYKILSDSRNNWILIKVLKIFRTLAPLEPRLAKRLANPICEHMRRTTAKSLMFECIRTVVTSLTDFDSAVRLAVEKIREFLVDDDPNLKYLGFNALSMLRENHLWAVLENKEHILKALSDVDPNIKLEALHLVTEMVSESNMIEIFRVLINYAVKSDPEFSNEILGSMLLRGSRNYYEIIADFDWYVSLLGEMSRNPHCKKGEDIEHQLIDIGLRVKDARPELVRVSRDLLIDPALLGNVGLHRVLCAAAWISGEYVQFSQNPFELLEALVQPRTNLLPPLVRAVYMQSTFKVLVFCFHSYFLQKEFFSPSNLMSETVNPEPGKQFLLDSIVEKTDFSSGLCSGLVEELAGQSEDTMISNEVTFNCKSVKYALDLVKMAVIPLSRNVDVELQDRVQNILGLIHLFEQNSDFSTEREECDRSENPNGFEIVKMIHDIILEEVTLVSATAQERISLPDGFVLVENLAEIETLLGEDLFPTVSFTIMSHGERDSSKTSSVSLQVEEEDHVTESTSLLAQHRKQHGLYYLPVEKEIVGSSYYPPANEFQVDVHHDDNEDLVKQAEKSLSFKKLTRSKPRPVVVKLDESDEIQAPPGRMKELKNNMLSDAVRDILIGNEDDPVPTKRILPKHSSQKIVKDASLERTLTSQVKENTSGIDHESTKSKSKDHRHNRERSRRSHKGEGNEETGTDSRKSSHHRNRHKNQRKSNASMDIIPKREVIPDFLL